METPSQTNRDKHADQLWANVVKLQQERDEYEKQLRTQLLLPKEKAIADAIEQYVLYHKTQPKESYPS